MKKTFLITAILSIHFFVTAQQATDNSNKFSVMFGLSQPLLLNGSNVAVTYMTRKWYFEYSHGMSLDLKKDGVGMTKKEKEELQSIHIPYSTGFGLGYRATSNLNRCSGIGSPPRLLARMQLTNISTKRINSDCLLTSA